jgi:hypothetical protein
MRENGNIWFGHENVIHNHNLVKADGFRKSAIELQGSILWSLFSAIFGQKMAFFFNTNVMIQFLQNLALFGVKIFANCFPRKDFKNHKIGPCVAYDL